MGFYNNTNTTKVVRAAVTTDEIWDLYKKAKAEYISREKNNLPGVVFYPEIKVSRERISASTSTSTSISTSTLCRLKLLGSLGSLKSVADGGSFKFLKGLLLPPETADEKCRDLMKDLAEHYGDSEYCNKAVIRWYLENSYAVCVTEGGVNIREHIFILDKSGEVLRTIL